MDGPPALETAHQIEELAHAVEDLQRRVELLEHRTELATLPVMEGAEAPAPVFEPHPPALPSGLLAGIGRVLLGIAGAYLLRAITEAGVISPLGGTLAGVLYAYGWLLPSRQSIQNNRWVAPLHALTASAILAPLLWESAFRFHALTSAATAAVLAGFVIAGQTVAWRRNSTWSAAIVTLAASASAIAFVMATLNPLPFSVALTAVAAVFELAAARDRLVPVRWIAAVPADFCALLLAYLITRPQGVPEGYAPVPAGAAMSILWSLVTIYVSSVAFRTLVSQRRISWWEIAQVVAVTALGIGTTLNLLPGRGFPVLAIGSGCLMAAAGSYMAAGFARARTSDRNTRAYAAFGLLLALVGGALLLRSLLLTVFWSILALASTDLGDYWRTNILRAHGAVYLIAGALAAGLFTWAPATGAAVLVAIFAGLVYILIVWKRGRATPPWPERAMSAIPAALLCWSLVCAATGSVTASLLTASVNCTLRTAVICLLALGLAWLGCRGERKELIWLLYPWMIFGAMKLVLDDVSHGESATLFVSLFVYGATLISLPRLVRAGPADLRRT